IAASTAQKMARLARDLRGRPLLRTAVRAGEVSVRQAEAVLHVARDEAEGEWVARARLETVRALKDAVKDPAAREDDEKWTRVRPEVPPELRPGLDEAGEPLRRAPFARRAHGLSPGPGQGAGWAS